jgi:lysylphosphatidylglycerol synthetase-like protein (DUF2156 family)
MAMLGLAALAGAVSFVDGDASQHDSSLHWWLGIAIAITVVLGPLWVAFFICLVAAISPAKTKWQQPSHSSPPFALSNPLLLLHLGAFAAVAFGLGMVLTSFLGGFTQFLEGMGTLLGGLSFYLGVRLGIKLCRHKMSEEVY